MQVTAARLVHHGKPLQIETVDISDPIAGEVIVDMAYAGVNPVDRYAAEGLVAPDAPLPRTLGMEGVGTVDGQWFLIRGYGIASTREGLWSRRAVVPEAALVPLPDQVQPVAAAAMGVAGVTAWRVATDLARLTADDRVLVLGASGGVGSMVVSIARGVSATVWGQTASAEKVQWITGQGASRVVVADEPGRLLEEVAGLSPTVVFDGLGGPYTGAAITALAPHGRLVLYGTSAGTEGLLPLQALYRKGLQLLGYGGLIEPDESMHRWMIQALGALADGRLQVAIDCVLPLDQVNQAFELLERRHVRGKVVLDLRS